MEPTVVAALISVGGSLIGALLGALAGNKLTQFRIEQLEKQVAKHNSIVERTYKLEGEMQEVQHDIRDLKGAR